jgi:hypothetical protein
MTVVAAIEVGDGVGGRPAPGPSFVDALVVRLAAEYGVDRDEVRGSVEAALAAFASAPVRTFIPILVEKRLREAYRGRPARL